MSNAPCELVRVVTGALDGAELPVRAACEALVRVVTGAADWIEPEVGAEPALVRVVTAVPAPVEATPRV